VSDAAYASLLIALGPVLGGVALLIYRQPAVFVAQSLGLRYQTEGMCRSLGLSQRVAAPQAHLIDQFGESLHTLRRLYGRFLQCPPAERRGWYYRIQEEKKRLLASGEVADREALRLYCLYLLASDEKYWLDALANHLAKAKA